MPLDEARWPQKSEALAKMDQVIDLLAEEHCWCKDHLRIDNRRCILGAMMDVDAHELLGPPVQLAILQVTKRRDMDIGAFNDSPATTHARVMKVLRQARANILCPPPEMPRQPAPEQVRAERAGAIIGAVAALRRFVWPGASL
jgi:hypothetical protein